MPCRKFGYQEGDFPHAEFTSREALRFPQYPDLNLSQQDEMIAAVSRFVWILFYMKGL